MRQGDYAEEFASECQKATAIKYSGKLGTGKEMGEGRGDMELEILGMNFGCVPGALQAWEFPEKDCLLPLVLEIVSSLPPPSSNPLRSFQFSPPDLLRLYIVIACCSNLGSMRSLIVVDILKILKHNSVRGLSLVSFELEVVGYTIALAYCIHKGLPFSAYGEFLFLLIQAIILVAIIYYYSQPLGGKTWIKPLLYCAIAPTIIAGQIDPFLFEALYASHHAIFFSARAPQIWTNYKYTFSLSCNESLHQHSGKCSS
ncbi:hypothetical protein ZIOFF_000496 [Zingiber officinale]|uniref:Mannose-P-dolichol utilization defect 1 protein homolog n=1 Tax=Zingiber officinale TaxID=94328 RepID=A0A8J5HTQ4_ZINOF|nr:hypothetical protein ZIOFF_000496 [Zingiber officinale]